MCCLLSPLWLPLWLMQSPETACVLFSKQCCMPKPVCKHILCLELGIVDIFTEGCYLNRLFFLTTFINGRVRSFVSTGIQDWEPEIPAFGSQFWWEHIWLSRVSSFLPLLQVRCQHTQCLDSNLVSQQTGCSYCASRAKENPLNWRHSAQML